MRVRGGPVQNTWSGQNKHPEGPSTQCLRFLVPKTIPLYWYLGPVASNIGHLDSLGHAAGTEFPVSMLA